MLAIGLMSGTSLDGVDTALCDITGYGLDTKVRLVDFFTHPFPESLREEVFALLREEGLTLQRISSLNFSLGRLFSEAVGQMLRKHHFSGKDLAFVASHGQTLYHQPKDLGPYGRSTLQLGEPSIMAYDHQVDVVANFRVMDVAAGGEGAPLVPLSERILYGQQGKTIALQNLGGIGNVTVLPGAKDEALFAFDTGPGNMVMDEAMKRLYGRPYDEGGQVALHGHVDEQMLKVLLQHPYLQEDLPKSTGREAFGENYTKEMLETFSHLKKEDLMATFTHFTAKTIALSYEQFIFPKMSVDEVIVGGGGAHNEAVLQALRTLLPKTLVKTQEDLGFSSDAKEAIAFVILGNESFYGRPGNELGATGAKEPVILGQWVRNPVPTKKEETLWLPNGQ